MGFISLSNLQRKHKKNVAIEDKIDSGESACEATYSCSCNGKPSIAIWFESNEEKSKDIDSQVVANP